MMRRLLEKIQNYRAVRKIVQGAIFSGKTALDCIRLLYTNSELAIACSLLTFVALAGCHAGHNASTQSYCSQNVKVFHLRGRVVSTNAAGEVTLNHEAIPGFMGAMIMPYKLKDPGVLAELHPGDVITADVLVSQDPDGDTLLDHIVVVAQAKPDYRPSVSYHVPDQGDAVPDFKLHNQDGRPIHLAQFRGRPLLVTFIYTRCPLPDFCPRVTRNFAQINRQLQANPAPYGEPHLLSVSFDPDHDTPARLRAYGATYIGIDAASAFADWDFAVPQKPVLLEMAKFFDVGITQGTDDSITHTLSTTLVGADGKVVRFYPGNEWTVDQVLADLKNLAASARKGAI
jgi:protein SCO1/2